MNRGVEDVCIVVCDGLKGLPDAITATWPKATVQTCVIHLTRASLRLSSARCQAPSQASTSRTYTIFQTRSRLTASLAVVAANSGSTASVAAAITPVCALQAIAPFACFKCWRLLRRARCSSAGPWQPCALS